MRYKTSCFNPTLAKHNLRRFWPLPVLIFAFFLVSMALNYYTSLVSTLSGTSGILAVAEGATDEVLAAIQDCRYAAYTFGPLVVVVQLVTALISALLVMHHIHGRKQIQFYHGLPLKRRCIYITNVVTGFLMGVLPLVLVEIIMLFMALGLGAELFPLWQLVGISVATFIIFYAIAILACTLAGQSFGAVLMYYGINFFVIAIMFGASGVARYMLYGFDEYMLLPDLTWWLTPLLMLGDRASCPLYTETVPSLPYGFPALPFIVYTIAGILLLVLGGFLYQKRRGETAGEMISFPVIRELCKVVVALIAGLGGTVVFILLMNPNEDLSFPVIALIVMVYLIVGWIAAEMVIRKTFRVFQKQNMAKCLSLAVIVLLVLVGGRLDVTGYVNKVPALSQVTGATIRMDGVAVEVEPDEALALHEFVLEHTEELSNTTSCYNTNGLTISYTIEGSDEKMTRGYYIKCDAPQIFDEFLSLMSDPTYVYRSWFEGRKTELTEDLIETTQLYCSSVYVEEAQTDVSALLSEGHMTFNYMELSSQETMAVYEAICRDIEEGNLVSWFEGIRGYAGIDYGTVEFGVFTDPYDPSMGSYSDYYMDVGYTCYNIPLREGMTHTLEALGEIGITINPEYEAVVEAEGGVMTEEYCMPWSAEYIP